MNFIIKVVGNLKNYLYICIMSLTKRWMDAQGIFEEEHYAAFDDDVDYAYEQWQQAQRKKEEDVESESEY